MEILSPPLGAACGLGESSNARELKWNIDRWSKNPAFTLFFKEELENG